MNGKMGPNLKSLVLLLPLLMMISLLIALLTAPIASPTPDDPPAYVYLSWATSDTAHTINVSWRTNGDYVGEVRYDTVSRGGDPGAYSYSVAGTGGVAPPILGGYIHHIELTGLEPDTIYYLICGHPDHGWSAERKFRTAPDQETSFRFVVGGDSRDDDRYNYHSYWPSARDSVSQRMAQYDPSFALFVGDYLWKGWGSSYPTDYAANDTWDNWLGAMDLYMNTTDGLTIPFIHVIGNHEITYPEPSNYDPETDAANYYALFDLPENERWYSLSWGPDLLIIVLDSEADVWDAGYATWEEQLDWLEEELQRSENYLWKMVAFHRPIASAGDWNTRRLEDWGYLFTKYGVDVVFQAHIHWYERSYPIDSDPPPGEIAPSPEEGVIYLTSGGWGGPLSYGSPESYTVYGPYSDYHFVLVDVFENGTLHFQAIDHGGNVFDEFSLTPPSLYAPSLESPDNNAFINDTTPTFDWSATTGADNYELQYATDDEFTTNLTTIDNIRETQYTVPGGNALTDTLWYWRVRAGTDADNVGPWSGVRNVTVDTVAPDAPALTAYTPDPTNDSTPFLEWSNVSDAENYTLKYATDSDFTQNVTTITGITTDNYQITSPLADSTWYWCVKSIDAANNGSSYSSYDSFTVDTTAPVAPIGLSASPSSWTNTNSFTVSWTNPSGGSEIAGAYYKLESVPTSSTDGTYVSGSGITSISGIAVSGDGSHPIYVWLKDEAGYVDHVNRSSTTLYLDTSVPGAPSLLRPSDGAVTNENAPRFEWTNGSGADNHKLLVDNDTDFSSPEIDVTLAVPEDTYAPTTGLTDDNYSWRVGAIDNAGNENASPVWTFIVDTTPPSAPTPSSPADNSATGDTTPTFSWSSVSDPSGVTYKLQIDDESTLSEPLVFENVDISDNTCTLPEGDALADGAYYWRVQSVDGAGNENMSEVWSFTVDTLAPGAPTLLSPENNATVITSIPTFNWSDVSDPSGVTYRIQVDASPADWASSAIDVSGLTSSSYTPTTSLADGSYEWRALAVDGAGNVGDWSSTRLLTAVTQPSSTTLTIDPASFRIQPENSITLTAVLTSGGNPLPDKLITWSPTAGTVSPSSGTTDAQGQVSTTYTAPDFETTVAIVASFAGDGDYYGSSWSSSGTIKTAPLELTLAVAFIPAGENHMFKFGSYPVPVFNVTITVDDNVENAEVTVEMVENVEVPVPPGMVHRYLNIETNIAPANITGLLARFKVSKSWVKQNDIGKKTIRVFEEVENEWRELPTRLVDEDSAYLYYEASMEGFSLFAITGGKAPVPILLYLALAVVGSAGGVGVAVLWVRSKRRSRLRRARYIAKRRKKGKGRAT